MKARPERAFGVWRLTIAVLGTVTAALLGWAAASRLALDPHDFTPRAQMAAVRGAAPLAAPAAGRAPSTVTGYGAAPPAYVIGTDNIARDQQALSQAAEPPAPEAAQAGAPPPQADAETGAPASAEPPASSRD